MANRVDCTYFRSQLPLARTRTLSFASTGRACETVSQRGVLPNPRRVQSGRHTSNAARGLLKALEYYLKEIYEAPVYEPSQFALKYFSANAKERKEVTSLLAPY